jgi:serine/threonine protein kinase
MGIVYRAWDTRLERDVAVKVLNAKILSDVSERKRFRREALSTADLSQTWTRLAGFPRTLHFARLCPVSLLV